MISVALAGRAIPIPALSDRDASPLIKAYAVSIVYPTLPYQLQLRQPCIRSSMKSVPPLT
jgi:hypothetical protein